MTHGDVIDRMPVEGEDIRTLSLFEATLEATADGILVVDRAGGIVRYNERFAQMWRLPPGLRAESATSRVLACMLDQLQNPPAFVRRVEQLDEQPLAESFDVLVLKDGRVYERYSRPQRLRDQVVGRVWSFRDVTDRTRAEEGFRLLQTLATALRDVDDLPSMLQVTLRKLCETTGWALGQAWVPTGDGESLVCGPAWAPSMEDVGPFRAFSRQTRFQPRVGLPGRVWASRAPEWVRDVTTDGPFLRAAVAREAGLHAAVGFPVFAGSEVVAVVEFLVRDIHELDERRMDLLASATAQLGSCIERSRAQSDLREIEARYWTLVERDPAAVLVLDVERSRFVSANDKAVPLFGHPRERLVALGPLDVSPPMQPGGRSSAELAREQVQVAVDGGVSIFEWTCRRADGRDFPCEVRLVGLPGPGDPLVRASFTDITERKRAEALRAGQTRVLEMIATGAPLEETLDHLVRLIESQSEGMVGSILLVDEDGVHLHHGAAPGLPDAYNRAIEGATVGPAVGSCGTAAYRREPVIVSDMQVDPLWADYRELAASSGMRACWSTPILAYTGEVLGTFAMYYRERHVPRPDDKRVIEVATHLAGIAIERRRAEEKLRRDAAEIQDLYESAPCGYHSVDLDGRFVRMNRTELSWLGYSREEVVGKKRLEDVLTPQSWVDFQAQLPRSEDLEPRRAIELEMVRKDGTLLPVLLGVSVVREASGAVLLRRAIVMDDTQRKQDERALRESERTYRALYTRTPAMLHSTDRRGRLLSVSDVWLSTLGYTRSEVIGRKVVDFLTPSSLRRIDQVACSRGRSCKDVPYQFVKKNGESMDVLLSAIAERDANERIVRSLAVLVDITARKRAEAALQRSKEELQSVMASVSDALWSGEVDPEGRWTHRYFSPVVERITGRPPEYYVPGPGHWLETVHPEDRSRLAASYDRLRSGASTKEEGEYRVMLPDGGVRWVRESARSTRSVGRLRIDGVTSDISDRKHVEEELQLYRSHLEELVAARTRKLDALNQELEAFCYSVSHDLRAPLRSIDGFSQILLEDYARNLDTRGRQHLARIRASSKRMAQLIDDLLNLSRVSRGELRMRPVDLSALARKVTGLLRETAPDRDVEFVIQEGVTAKGDPHLLRVVLDNLFANAWKFTSTHPRARIEFGRLPQDGHPVYFIRDDGAGFDMAYVDKLFGAFQRLHSPDEFEGTGIGLATVQRVVQRHGGRIWAEAAIEKGATFYFTLSA